MNQGLHIYRANDQPATNYLDCCGPKPMRFRVPARHTFRCFNCHKKRWAKYLIVHVYYDSIKFFCRDGCGCKA